MNYTSLSEITVVLISVIQHAIDQTGHWPGLIVTPELPRDEKNGIGLYLFHTTVADSLKNPESGIGTPPVHPIPMALNLFYHLSANSRNDANEEDVLDEQRLMSVAMKALYDNPVVKFPVRNYDEKTVRITFLNLPLSELSQHWAALKSPVRLSAYYQVSVVFLEADNT